MRPRPAQIGIAAGLSFALAAGLVAIPWKKSSSRPGVTPTGMSSSPSPIQSSSAKPAASESPSAKPATKPAIVSRVPCGRLRARRTVSFRVELDPGLATTPSEFARAIRQTLCDGRSWIASGEVRFRYDPTARLLIGLRSPDETERRCMRLIGLSVNHFYSCGTPREIAINADRWFRNSPYFPSTLQQYRRMLTNHEVGHALGLHHVLCPAGGSPAPVMMQQSKGMRSPNGRTCRPNPWPLAVELTKLS